MGEFILWLLITLILTGGATICGYKTKEAWDGWHHTTIAGQVKNSQDSSLAMKTSNVDVAKLRIGRAFEDFNKKLRILLLDFLKSLR